VAVVQPVDQHEQFASRGDLGDVRTAACLDTVLSAAAARWRQATVVCYGHSDTIELAQTPAIWYGAFANTAGRAVLLREPGENILAIFTTDIISDAEQIVAR